MSTAASIPEIKLRRAVHTLFGAHPRGSTNTFLCTLHRARSRPHTANGQRKRTLISFSVSVPPYSQRQSALFQEVLESYNLFSGIFQHPATQVFTVLSRNRTTIMLHTMENLPPPMHSTTHPPPVIRAGSIPVTYPSRLELGRYLYYRGRYPMLRSSKHSPGSGTIARNRRNRRALGMDERTHCFPVISCKGKPILFGERAVHLAS